MTCLLDGSVSVYDNDTIVVQFTLQCENALVREIERQNLENWLTQMAKAQNASYGTIRRTGSGEVEYGDLE